MSKVHQDFKEPFVCPNTQIKMCKMCKQPFGLHIVCTDNYLQLECGLGVRINQHLKQPLTIHTHMQYIFSSMSVTPETHR